MIYEAITNYAEYLGKLAGLPVVLDPRDANPPCIVLQLSQALNPTLAGDWSVEVTPWIVTVDNGYSDALAVVLGALEKLGPVTTTATPDVLTLPDSAPLPALRLDPIDVTSPLAIIDMEE